MKKLFYRLFLIERSSISLSLYRIFVALTVGFYALPTFAQFKLNYLQGAFKTYDPYFLTAGFIEWAQKSPDGLAVTIFWIFFISWLFFLIGFLSQLSCIVMTLGCYYFYALNAFHLSSLSWYILMVFLFLMCLTPYHGDYFSLDCLRRNNMNAYNTKRPFFIQRLLQLQIGFIFFYTALYKITVEGNWLKGNPIYHLMNYPPQGVVKMFLLKDFLYDKPQLCYMIGLSIVIVEIFLILFLFYRKTRLSAIYLGIFFHVLLILTLDVPAFFFFLFPPTLLLFINPNKIIHCIEQKQKVYSAVKRGQLFFDGNCGFCQRSVQKLKIMDMYRAVDYVDFRKEKELEALHPKLKNHALESQIHFLDVDGKLYGGYDVFKRLSFMMPMMFFVIPILYFPGMGMVGPMAYRFIAKNRYLFHFNKDCKNNSCFR